MSLVYIADSRNSRSLLPRRREPSVVRFEDTSLLRQPVIFDGRNLFDPELVRNAGFEYLPIGRRQVALDCAR